MSNKTKYLIKTLSRTTRKDYENYVLNSIWSKLNNDSIKPVTQQYVSNKSSGLNSYIDLYFPQLNIGVEVDELYHSQDSQSKMDENRTLSIADYFNKVEVGHDYIEYRISVYDEGGKAIEFKELNKKIDEIVYNINQKINSVRFKPWITDLQTFLNENEKLTVNDDVVFKTIIDVSNNLFNTDYKAWRKGLIQNHKWDLENEHTNIDLWFPQLAIEVEGGLISANKNWNNQIDLNGNIIEFQEGSENDIDENFYEDVEGKENDRYVFAKSKDIYGQNAYKFIGRYKKTNYFAKNHKGSLKKASFFVKVNDALKLK